MRNLCQHIHFRTREPTTDAPNVVMAVDRPVLTQVG